MRKMMSPPIGGVLLALAVLATFFTGSSNAKNTAALSNATILIIRHAEEPSKGDGLSSRGTERAQRYVEYFKNFTIDGKPLEIDHLFAVWVADPVALRREGQFVRQQAHKRTSLPKRQSFKRKRFR